MSPLQTYSDQTTLSAEALLPCHMTGQAGLHVLDQTGKMPYVCRCNPSHWSCSCVQMASHLGACSIGKQVCEV